MQNPVYSERMISILILTQDGMSGYYSSAVSKIAVSGKEIRLWPVNDKIGVLIAEYASSAAAKYAFSLFTAAAQREDCCEYRFPSAVDAEAGAKAQAFISIF